MGHPRQVPGDEVVEPIGPRSLIGVERLDGGKVTWVAADFDYVGGGYSTGQIFSDLACSLVLVSVWMLKDAKERGLYAWPFVVAMLPLGSFAWMVYFLYRELAAQPAKVGVAAAR